MAITTIALSNTFDEWRIAFNQIVAVSNAQLDSAVLATLTTTVTATLVGAINELDANNGDLTTLTTTDKTSLVNAINEIDNTILGFAKLATANIFTQSQTIDKAGAIGAMVVGGDKSNGQTTQYDALGHNSVGTNKTYARLCQVVIDNTNTSEDGSWELKTLVAGTLGTRMTIAQGLYMIGTTDQGVGTINATDIYLNNVNVSAKLSLPTIDNFASPADFNTGVTTQLTMTGNAPLSENDIDIWFDGVYQHHNTFTVVGLIVTFNAVIPLNVLNIEIKHV